MENDYGPDLNISLLMEESSSMGLELEYKWSTLKELVDRFSQGYLTAVILNKAELYRNGMNGIGLYMICGISIDDFGKTTSVMIYDLIREDPSQAKDVDYKIMEKSIVYWSHNSLVSMEEVCEIEK